jgi:hypothetical protein
MAQPGPAALVAGVGPRPQRLSHARFVVTTIAAGAMARAAWAHRQHMGDKVRTWSITTAQSTSLTWRWWLKRAVEVGQRGGDREASERWPSSRRRCSYSGGRLQGILVAQGRQEDVRDKLARWKGAQRRSSPRGGDGGGAQDQNPAQR